MYYDYVKVLKVGELAEGENSHNVMRIGGTDTIEELEVLRQHYLANGYEMASQEEWEANSTPVEEAPVTE